MKEVSLCSVGRLQAFPVEEAISACQFLCIPQQVCEMARLLAQLASCVVATTGKLCMRGRVIVKDYCFSLFLHPLELIVLAPGDRHALVFSGHESIIFAGTLKLRKKVK